MALVVQKYGGTSVAGADRIKEVARAVIARKREGYQMLVVVSAMGDTTDDLVEVARQITAKPDPRELDMLLATGEQQSIALLAMAIKDLGEEAVSFTGAQVGIVTDGRHTKARIIQVKADRIKRALADRRIVIVAGFQGESEGEEITTLGRGGSDLTAVALAQTVRAQVCEFYKDVKGIMTTNPQVVPDARVIPVITYDEMLEMASLGSQVLNARSVEYAKRFKVPLVVKSSFEQSDGTLVVEEERGMEKVLVRGITYAAKEAKVTVLGVPDKPGVAAEIFRALATADLNIDMIIQDVSESGVTNISFTVSKGDLNRAMEVMRGSAARIGAEDVHADENVGKVSVIGIGMRSHSGVAAAMFEALAQARINIQMISTSEIKISCVIDRSQVEEAVRVLHRRFRLNQEQLELGKPFVLAREELGRRRKVRTKTGGSRRRSMRVKRRGPKRP